MFSIFLTPLQNEHFLPRPIINLETNLKLSPLQRNNLICLIYFVSSIVVQCQFPPMNFRIPKKIRKSFVQFLKGIFRDKSRPTFDLESRTFWLLIDILSMFHEKFMVLFIFRFQIAKQKYTIKVYLLVMRSFLPFAYIFLFIKYDQSCNIIIITLPLSYITRLKR